MNIATLIGFIFGVAILTAATFASTDSVGVFINLAGIAIVGGGTIASTFICYPLKEVMRVLGVFAMAISADELPLENYINVIVNLSKKVSRSGTDELESSLRTIDNDFLREGLQMYIDGYSEKEIKEILNNRIKQYHEQEYGAAGIFRTMANLAPAFGIIGTLIGLIAMMQGMGEDIKHIGPAMATALTTTLYGALLANMIFTPIAIKVEKKIDEITVMMCIIRDGILLIKEKTPPEIVMDMLKGYLPPRKWSSVKASK